MNRINDSFNILKPKSNCECTTLYNITNCKQCELNGFTNEKISLKFVGLRPETEDGFIYRFAKYDYSNMYRKHVHKPEKTTTAKAGCKYDVANLLKVFSS